MQELLVLGLVPGTNIQITFAVWLGFMISLALLYARFAVRKYQLIPKLAVTVLLMLQTRRQPA